MSVPIGKWTAVHALRNGDSPALVDADTGVELTFKQLDERTTRLASSLKQRGVQPGDRVGICSTNNPAMLEILIATAKLGAITVMINFRLTAAEANFILSDSGAEILFAASPLLDVATTAAAGTEVREIISLPIAAERLAGESGVLEEMIANGDPNELLVEVDPESPAVLMYTSGTTGRPKGAMVSHSNFFWVAIYHNSFETGLNRYDRNIVAAPLFHIGALALYTLPGLYWGASSYVLESFSPDQWAATVQKYGCTKAFAVPTMWGALMQSGALQRHDVSSLDIAISGGAPCPIPVIEGLQELGIAFTEGFGMTETTSMASSLASRYVKKKAGSVGLPALHVDFRVVDDHGNDVLPGEVGELIIRGPSVIKSYWNRPDANAESFKDGWFYGGDLARVDEEGFFYLVDRKKDMIITGGENVYPVEVEQALYAHKHIADVAVIGTPDDKWGETVTAVIVVSESAGEDRTALLADIEAHARERIAAFKIPRRYAFMDALPRTSTGKVQKFDLRSSVGDILVER